MTTLGRHAMGRTIWVALAGLCMLTTVTSAAPPSSNSQGRELGGYRFLVSAGQRDPFITTHFRNELGYARATGVEFPFIVVDTTVLVSPKGDYAFLVADLEYQHAINHRLALRFTGRGASRIGTNGDALLAQGVSAFMNWTVGGLYELWRNEQASLAADASAGQGTVMSVDLIRYAEDVLAGNIADAAFVRTDVGGHFNLGLRGALATSHWTGVTADVGLGVNDFGERKGEVHWRTGASFGMDFAQRDAMPVGVLVQAALAQINAEAFTDGASREIGMGIYYTGREDLQLGFNSSWAHMPLSDLDSRFSMQNYSLSLRYYF